MHKHYHPKIYSTDSIYYPEGDAVRGAIKKVLGLLLFLLQMNGALTLMSQCAM